MITPRIRRPRALGLLMLATAIALLHAALDFAPATAQEPRPEETGRVLRVVDNADGIVVDMANAIVDSDLPDVHGSVIHRSIFRWGFDATYKRLSWVPLHITLRSYFSEARTANLRLTYGQKDDRVDLEVARGSVALSPKPPDQSPTPVEVMFHLPPMDYAAGETLHLYVTDEGGNTLLRDFRILRDPKFNEFAVWQPIDRLAFRIPKQSIEGDAALALAVLGDGAVAPDAPKPLIAATAEADTSWAKPAKPITVTTVEMDLRYLPDHWLGYDAVDIVYLFNPKWDLWRAAPGRLNALREWVHTGGRLVLVASMRADELAASGFFGSLAGVSFLAPTTASDLSGLMEGIAERGSVAPRWSGAGAQERAPLSPAFRNSPTQVAGTLEAVQLKPGIDVYAAYGVADDGTHPLVTQCHRGLGTVTTFAFDFTDPALRGWTARPHVLGALLDYDVDNHFRRPSAPNEIGLSGLDTKPEDDWGYRTEYNRFNGKRVLLDQSAVIPVLRRIEQANPVPFPILAVFITLYVLVIGPLDYFLLKKLNLMTWTWFTFIFAAIAFFAFAWYGAEQIRGGEMEVVQITTIDFANDDSPFYRGNLQAGLFSQKSATYRLYLDDQPSAGLSRLLTTYVDPMDVLDDEEPETGSSVLGTLAVGQQQQREITGILLPQWRIRLVDGTWAGLHDGAKLSATFSPDGQSVTITNGLPYAVEGVTLWSREHRGVPVVARLGSGESTEIALERQRVPDPDEKYNDFLKTILSNADPFATRQTDGSLWGGYEEPERREGDGVVTAMGDSGDIVRESLSAAGTLHAWQHFKTPPDKVDPSGNGYVYFEPSMLDRLDLTTQVMQPQPSKRDPILITAMALRADDVLRSEHPNPVPLRVDGWEPLYTSYVMVRLLAYPPHEDWQTQTRRSAE